MYWERGKERRIYFAARHWLHALDATNGKPLTGFGRDGRIDLREGFEGRDPRSLSVGVNTPGVFYRDLLIVGSIVPEGLPSAPGDIRAFDVNTGRQKWAFTPSRIPENSATTRGRRTRGSTAAARTRGRDSRS